ncbi:MAG: hypothetical protein M3P15_07735 [Actinomycetota bacterium]|nr:hypothetical protein [Actinomycetota bacterium]
MTPRNERTPEEMQTIATEADVKHISSLIADELARLTEDTLADHEEEAA